MSHFDVFNGDADGLCALHQLRLADPRPATLVTGPKRDVALLRRVDARPGDTVTVLDVALEANRDALLALLARDVAVEYFDHHYAGDVPAVPGLRAVIDPSPSVCTAVLVDRHLGGAHRLWAIVGAFGDGLAETALALARTRALDGAQTDALRALGETLAYGAYGDRESDLVIPPVALYRRLAREHDPFAFAATEPMVATIAAVRAADLAMARSLAPWVDGPGATVHRLPDAVWSRRARGPLASELANADPGRAHAVLAPVEGGFTVSLRAPPDHGPRADAFCRQFRSGGGRALAAGINHLPSGAVAGFVARLADAYR